MKKIIAVAAGALLVGSVSIASADVTFTGDARERLTWDKDVDFNKKQANYDYGRIRLNAQMENKGGAYARVRMIFGYNSVWDGTAVDHPSSAGTVSGNPIGTQNYETDWAYVGIPIGPVTVEAGLMPDYSSLWFLYDKRFDRLKATFVSPDKNTTVAVLYDKAQEYIETPAYLLNPNEDYDINQWGGMVVQKFAGWEVMGYGIYQEDQNPTSVSDKSGFEGTARVKGPAGPVNLLVEMSYKDKKIQDTKDSGYGGIVHANMNFGPADATAVLGFTKDGFVADSNYGFLMMGGAMAGDPSYYVYEGTLGSPINGAGSPLASSSVSAVGKGGDNTFAGLIADYKINSLVTLYGGAVYDDIKDYGKFTEFDGVVQFNVVQDAYISLGAACLIPSLDAKGAKENTNYGMFTELFLKF